jgi:hypothetical protein
MAVYEKKELKGSCVTCPINQPSNKTTNMPQPITAASNWFLAKAEA